MNMIQACKTANYAAGIVVGEVGTAAVQAGELVKILMAAGKKAESSKFKMRNAKFKSGY
jgi:bifunctional ADP-heptose synthase (sugar kinase/adenylyltransferase)